MSSDEFEYFFEPEELGLSLDANSAESDHFEDPESTVDAEPVSHNEPKTDKSAESDVEKIPTPPKPDPVAPLQRFRAPATADAGTSPERPVDQARTNVRRLLSVHALGQFEYCPRSAILAAEIGDESDIDEPPPRLDYLPNYDLERIEEYLSKYIRRLLLGLFLVAGLTLVMIAGLVQANRVLFYPAFAGFLPCVMWLMHLVGAVLQLSLRRRAALRAELREPDPRVEGITAVNWWSMLKAGFEPVRYERPLRHPELPLEGNPWRVLERGSVRIPVAYSGSDRLGERDNHVFPKHRIRLAAYALLLESMGHVEVPYGIVFPVDSVSGLAIPITRALQEEATRRLDNFSQILLRSQNGECEPNPPRDRRRCEKCRHGEPTLITPDAITQARTAGTPLLVLQQAGDREYHCLCGDRFGSAPPHGRSIKLGLSSLLE